jgi:small-conductance mechanosensitive channel
VPIAAAVLDRARASFGDALPGLAGALVLLVVGLFLAWLAGRLAARALGAVGLDGLAERAGLLDILERIGLRRSLSRLVGRAIRITLSVVVVIAALSVLGLGALSASLNAAVLFLPKLLVALALVLAGVVVAEWVAHRAGRVSEQMDLAFPAGRMAYVVVLALFVLTALAQVGIPTGILTLILGVLIVAAALTVALAFGLGGREVARQLSAGRYVGDSFELGQTISVGGVRGEIAAFQSAATVLRAEDGGTVRVPNSLLLESIVTVDGEAPQGA